jgi:hypothetical protein
MHWRKKITFGCFVSFIGTAAFCLYSAIVWHEFPLVLFLVSLGLACFSGYRCFCFSDDWFRTTNERQAIWARHHPRLQIASGILGLVVWVLIITWNIHRHH